MASPLTSERRRIDARTGLSKQFGLRGAHYDAGGRMLSAKSEGGRSLNLASDRDILAGPSAGFQALKAQQAASTPGPGGTNLDAIISQRKAQRFGGLNPQTRPASVSSQDVLSAGSSQARVKADIGSTAIRAAQASGGPTDQINTPYGTVGVSTAAPGTARALPASTPASIAPRPGASPLSPARSAPTGTPAPAPVPASPAMPEFRPPPAPAVASAPAPAAIPTPTSGYINSPELAAASPQPAASQPTRPAGTPAPPPLSPVARAPIASAPPAAAPMPTAPNVAVAGATGQPMATPPAPERSPLTSRQKASGAVSGTPLAPAGTPAPKRPLADRRVPLADAGTARMPSAAMKYGDEQDQKTLKQLEAQLATAASPKARNALFAKIEEARARINRREELLNMPVPGA